MELVKNLVDLQNAFLVLHFIRMGSGRCIYKVAFFVCLHSSGLYFKTLKLVF